MYQVTVVFSTGGSNRYSMKEIPHIGEELAVVHGDGQEEVYRITRVRPKCLPSLDRYGRIENL